MRWFRVIVIWALAATLAPCTGDALAHGVVGDYEFIEPLVAEDANPKNEIVIARPQWTRSAEGRELSLGFSAEKQLSQNLSLALESEYTNQSPDEERPVSGFDNLEILVKYAFLTLPEHETRLSLGLSIEVPTGNPSTGAETKTRIGPELLWAKGFGDLPNSQILRYFRPFGIQGDVGYLPRINGPDSQKLFADILIEYSLPYLSNSVRDFGLKWPIRNLYLFTEFNYEQMITGKSGTAFPEVRMTPGIAYMDPYIQLSVGTQFPLNGATVPESHAAILGLLDIFIDDIFPQTRRTLF